MKTYLKGMLMMWTVIATIYSVVATMLVGGAIITAYAHNAESDEKKQPNPFDHYTYRG